MLELRLKRNYKIQEGDMLERLKLSNPKHLYRLFAKKKNKKNSSLENEKFYEHFKNLMCGRNDEVFIPDLDQEPVYEELDEIISREDILKAINKLKTNKSCSEDLIINDIFIKGKDILLPLLACQ